MQIEVKITTGNAADAARLAQALQVLAGNTATKVEVTATKVEVDSVELSKASTPAAEEKPKRETGKKSETKSEPIHADDEPETTGAEDLTEDDLSFDEGATEIKDEDLRAACSAKGAAVGREKVKAFIDAFGFGTVVKIPKEERARFLKELDALA